MVKISEDHRGVAKSSTYYYVKEGDTIYHISRYAKERETVLNHFYIYFIEFDKIKDKTIIQVNSSSVGIYPSLTIIKGEEFSKYNNPFLISGNSQPLSYLNKFNFGWLLRGEVSFLKNDWNTYYMPMITEIRSIVERLGEIYARELGYPSPFYILPNLLDATIKGNASYPISYLIPYSKKARDNSLQVLTREIHQIWIISRILDSRYSRLSGFKVDFKQSSSTPVFIYDNYSVWYEFDLHPLTMCDGMLWRKEVEWVKVFYKSIGRCINNSVKMPLRPDIVILRNAESCEDLEHGLEVEAIIEAKNWPFEKWVNDIDRQILPYKCIFDPKLMIVASLYPVPAYMKQTLAKKGVYVVDNVYSGGNGINEILGMIP
ncbi:hypothetical protein [Sulfolobus sp. E11-6]|uniref:hypothetical protein n=1 Tax=Sulfolobus sp. E11-6 TaxID=2663020 RepID=UPI0012953D1B|nr:hypothetical protein [Sulfolobus sp. E11-6]QGA68912.1 hypothetical protein GFS33_09450 [Sulfolobus sp. E11-6]